MRPCCAFGIGEPGEHLGFARRVVRRAREREGTLEQRHRRSSRPAATVRRPTAVSAAARSVGSICCRPSTRMPRSIARSKGPCVTTASQAARRVATAVAPSPRATARLHAATRLSSSSVNARRRAPPPCGRGSAGVRRSRSGRSTCHAVPAQRVAGLRRSSPASRPRTRGCFRYIPKYGSSSSWRVWSIGTQVRSRLLSTSAWTASTIGGASGQDERSSTASAASSVKPPSNTEHCASAACSQGSSRSHDQSIAPLSVAWRSAAPRAPASRAKRSRQPLDELRRRQHPDARRRQLDRQRQAVEQGDDALDGRAVRRREREVGALRAGPQDEQLDALAVERERLERQHFLAGEAKPLAARDQEAGVGARSSQRPTVAAACSTTCSKLSRITRQRPRVGDRVAELDAGIALAERHVERERDDEEHAVQRARLGEVAEADAARPIAEPAPAVAARQPRLAGAAGAEHGQRAARRRRAGPRRRARSAARPTNASRSRGRLWRDLAHRPPAARRRARRGRPFRCRRAARTTTRSRTPSSKISTGSAIPFSR